ncbi:uncharacterized protein LOC114286160 [Camellia sinensis]|uniref:uncharacterized protein LOC114286160 n=1 Tax=Camellia sinensis TaxID=4442 RepID=UPI001035E0D2|nr:uncharacterized protein LOC114286160 [Camellia sinensis]
MGLIQGPSVGSNELKISHLQFANGIIIFCEAEWEEIIMIKRILRCFVVMSGLKINFHKSTVCGIGVEERRVMKFATKLNCLSQRLPLTYLGLPLGANPRSRSTWQTVVEKCKKKLASWKKRFLSFDGRLTLIRSVLSSIPLFFLSLFKMVVGVAKTIDKIQSSFLWGDSETSRKIHLVNWKEVYRGKSQRGLAVRNLIDVNVMHEFFHTRWGILCYLESVFELVLSEKQMTVPRLDWILVNRRVTAVDTVLVNPARLSSVLYLEGK